MSILNSINNAIQGISNAANDLFGGSVAQPGLSLLGTNLPGVPLVSFRDTFLASLNQWNTSIPLNTQFIVLIDRFPLGLTTNIIQQLEPISNSTGFDITLPKAVTTNLKNQGIVGCLFATGFNIPSENITTDSANIPNNRGFIEGTILKDRAPFNNANLTLEFRETNTSFIDFVIRPWLIMSSHFGFVARNQNNIIERIKDPKCNITIVQYTRSNKGLSQIPRKMWNFYNCVPVNISDRTYTNDANSEGVKTFNTTWVYDRYEVSSNLFMKVDQLIKSLNPFSF